MNSESQTDEYIASIFDAIDVHHFVQCLCDSQNITRKTALEKLEELVKNGLILHVSKTMEPATPKKEIPRDEAERSTRNAVKYQSLFAPDTSINVVRYDGSSSKEPLILLTIKKEQAFHIFERIGLKEPYPWPTYFQSLSLSESPTDTPSKSENELDDLANNKERGSVKKLLAALLSLNYGREWYKTDIEIFADEFIKDLSQKGIDEPLERRALLRWFAKVQKKAASNDQ